MGRLIRGVNFMLKKKIYGLLSVVLMFVNIGLVGCTQGGNNITLDVSTDNITIVLGEEPENESWEMNTAKFTVSTNVSTQVVYRIENEGVIRVDTDTEHSYSTTKTAIVTALKTGTAKIVVFTPESSSVYKEIIVNVVQPITSIEFVQDYALFIPIGEQRAIDIDNAFNIEPLYGNKNDLRFEIIDDQYNLGATIDEISGVIDASNVTNVGNITVRAYTTEEIYADTIVHIVSPISGDDVSVATEAGDIIMSNGEFVSEAGNKITLIKTTEENSTITLNVNVNSLSEYEIDLTIANPKAITYQKVGSSSFVIKALELGQSDLNFSINILGATGIEPYEFTLDVNVYDKPLDININGLSASSMDYVYNTTIYNNYNQGELGTPFRFTLNPSTVTEENSDLTITFNNPNTAVNAIAVFNVYGDRLGIRYDANGNMVSLEPFTIKAGDTIYIKSTLNQVNSEQFSFVVSSVFSVNYPPEVSATVNLTLREGISEFSYDRSNLYIEQGQSQTVYLNVGRDNADTSGIYYEVEGDAVEVVKVTGDEANNRNYIIIGQKLGDAVVTFYSGNGFEIVINVKVYNPLTELLLTSESPLQNGAIGEREFVNDSLAYIAVATGSRFNLQYITNLGASVANVRYEVINGNTYVSTTSEGLVSILGTGTATIRVSVYGYDQTGIMADPLYKTVTVEGYVPVSSIALNNTTLYLKDYESVGYYRVAEYSQKQLVINTYPSNAEINEEDITWTLVGEGGSITNTTGFSTLFTAGPLNDFDSTTLRVLVSVIDHGRVFSQVCNIEVTKAIKVEDVRLVNVFNSEIYFDGRDGLGAEATTFNVLANTYPTNAFNNALRYIYIHTDEENTSPVFSVDAMGNVRPIRGGSAILRIAAEDSFVNMGEPSVYTDVKVVVADGKTKETAYRLYDAQDLLDIGKNSNSLNSFYVLANDIDLSSISSWTPIGVLNGQINEFNGYLSGQYIVGIGDNEQVISSRLYGINLTKGVNVSNETTDTSGTVTENIFIASLFAKLGSSAQFENLEIEYESISIDLSSANYSSVYVGGLVAVQEDLNDDGVEDEQRLEEGEFVFENVEININNVNISNASSRQNVYFGGLIANYRSTVLIDYIDSCTVNATNVSISGTANSLYAGGLVGYIDALATIQGTYTQSTETGVNYGSVFGDAGFDVVADFNISASATNSAVGGLVGYAQNVISLSNVGFKGSINATSVDNVGGLAGVFISNNTSYINLGISVINTVTTFGKVVGHNNVGGLVGDADVRIFNAIVENYGDIIAQGNQNVGGAIGNLRDGRISLGMVTSSNNSASVVGVTNVGTMIGNMASGLLEAVYTDISTSVTNIVLVGTSGNNAHVSNSFVTQGAIGVSNATNCYAVTDYSSAINAWNALTEKRFELSEILSSVVDENNQIITEYYTAQWLQPGTNGINDQVNNGYPIFGLVDSLPFYNVIPTSIEITIKENNSLYKIDDSNVLMFYYELTQTLIDNTSAKDLATLYKNALALNTIDLNAIDFIEVNVYPQSFRVIRLDLEALATDSNASSDVLQTTADGKVIIQKEGVARLKVSSVINPEANDELYVNTLKRVTSFALNSSDLGNSSEALNSKDFEIRKGESGYYFVYLENYDKLNNINYNYTDKFEIVYTIYATENDNLVNIVVDAEGNPTSYTVNHIIDRLNFNDVDFEVAYNFDYQFETDTEGEFENITYLMNSNKQLPQDFLTKWANGAEVQYVPGDTIDVYRYATYKLEVNKVDNYIAYYEDDEIANIMPIYLYSLSAKSYTDGMHIINTLQESHIGNTPLEGSEYTVNVALNYVVDKFTTSNDVLSSQKESILVKDVANSLTSFDLVIYDGAISIESTINSAVNVPGDVVNVGITLITDNSSDELEVVEIEDVIIELSKVEEKAIEGGKYQKDYTLSVSLVDEFDVRHLSTNKELNIEVYSTLLEDKRLIVPVTFVPQQVQRMNIYKYAVSNVSNSNYEAYGVNDLVITTNEPSILQINVYPYYSHIDEIEIKSSMYEDTSILFEQMIHTTGQNYRRLIPQSQATDDRLGLNLQQYSRYAEDGVTRVYDGNLYVKLLLNNNVPKNTEFTITINAYNYDVLGNRVLVSTNSVVLLSEEIPELAVTTATESPYIVKGVQNILNVNFKPTADGQDYSQNVTVSVKGADNNYQTYIPDESNMFGLVDYKKGAVTTEDGRRISEDVLNVGIGVPTGARITIVYTVRYQINNIEKELNVSKTFTVVDYDIQNISIYSFGSESHILNMDVNEAYQFGVENVLFKVAPEDYEDASNAFGYNEAFESEYYKLYYGYGVVGDRTVNVSYNAGNGTFEYDGKPVVAITELTADGTFTSTFKYKNEIDGNVTYSEIESFTPGVYLKMLSAKRTLQNRVDFFKRQTAPNTYESFIDYSDPNVGVYVRQSLNETDYEISGLRYAYSLIGVTPMMNQTMMMSIDYAYNDDGELIFDSLPSEHANYTDYYTYNIQTRTSFDVPIPIYTQQELAEMTAGENYILMNDITLVNWVPISTGISSLDGNGYNLIIRNFDTSTGNIGLFNTVQEDTILKNITINISQMESVIDMYNFEEVYFGLLAVTNEGTITNCAISAENLDGSQVSSGAEKSITINTNTLLDGTLVRVMAGLLVYENNNAITNSRVGDAGVTGDTITSSRIISLTAAGDLAGFVCQNGGHISSSYAKHIKIINTLDVASNSQTAGFVAANGGTIVSSYVRGSQQLSEDEDSLYSEYGLLSSNGSIGGFVYSNSGSIQDAYSNINIQSNARTAGFVFSNIDEGTITNAYSASKISTNSALHMPFIGVDDKSVIQCDDPNNITNVYYYVENNKDFEASAVEELASPILKSNFGTQSNFAGFAFSVAGEYNAIWTMTDGYPDLYEANVETISERELIINENNQIEYYYKNNYNLGTEENPYIIASASDYNYYFGLGLRTDNLVESKYFRLINDVDFEAEDATIDAITKQLTLYNTSIEGNGFTISNVVITADIYDDAESTGLFKRIYSVKEDSTLESIYKSTIKNLNIIIREGNGVGVSYVGGLAGIVEDSNIFNVDVSAINYDETSVIKGNNVVGGLAGVIRGDCVVLNITSSVSVEASFRESSGDELPNYYIAETKDATNVSHAGSIAGVVDIIEDVVGTASSSSDSEDSSRTANRDKVFLVQNANVQNVSVSGPITVNAEFAGGLFGYVGSNTHIYNANFEVTIEGTQYISSDYTAGGLVGINFGKLTQARIEHSTQEQEAIDESIENNLLNGDTINRGKTDLFQGDLVYAGGIIGMNMGGHLEYAYSRVDIVAQNTESSSTNVNREQYLGGLIGITYGGKVMQVYASGTVVTKSNDRSYAGGIIGRVDDFNIQIASDDVLDSTELQITDVYALNYWDNLSIVTRNGGRYVGKIIGYSNSDLIQDLNPEEDSLNRVAYIMNNESNIFSGLTDTYYTLKLVGDGRYASLTTDEFVPSDLKGQYLETLNMMFEQTSSSIATVSNFFTGLHDEYWIKYPDSIYPVFKAGAKSSEQPIYTAKDFIDEANRTPYKTFVIMNDLDFSGITKTGSLITSLFTGDIVSGVVNPENTEERLSVNFYNITLNADENTTNLALLSSMRKASISNINFHFKEVATSSATRLQNVGLISAVEESTSYNNVHVVIDSRAYTLVDGEGNDIEVAGDNEDVEENVGDKLITKATNDYGGITIDNANNIGAFSAVSNGTTVVNGCSVSGSLTSDGVSPSSYTLKQGGFFGSSNVLRISNSYVDAFSNNVTISRGIPKANRTDKTEGDIITGVNMINFKPNTSFSFNAYLGNIVGEVTGNITANTVSVITNNTFTRNDTEGNISARIGGMMGYAQSATLNNCNVLSNSYPQTSNNPDINVSGATRLYLGGVGGEVLNVTANNIRVGKVDNIKTDAGTTSTIYKVNISAEIKASTLESSVGGAFGYAININNNSRSASASSFVYADIDVSHTSKPDSGAVVSVGGFVGRMLNYANRSSEEFIQSKINTVGTINVNNLSNAHVGGIIGTVVSNIDLDASGDSERVYVCRTILQNSYSLMNITATNTETLVAGGAIGNSSYSTSTSNDNTGRLEVNYVMSAGYINAVGATNVTAGGLVGVHLGEINYSIVATTIFTDERVTDDKGVGFNSNIVIELVAGNHSSTSVVEMNGVVIVDALTMSNVGYNNSLGNYVLSSNGDVYEENETITQEELIDLETSRLGSVYQTELYDFEVEDYESGFGKGSVLSPILVTNATEFSNARANKGDILYYMQTENFVFDNINFVDESTLFNGVYNGNNKIITLTSENAIDFTNSSNYGLFGIINSTGAVSKLAIMVEDLTINQINDVNFAVLAGVNKGTIYGVYVKGNINIASNVSSVTNFKLAGVVSDNAGVISTLISDIKMVGKNLKTTLDISPVMSNISYGILFNAIILGSIEIYNTSTSYEDIRPYTSANIDIGEITNAGTGIVNGVLMATNIFSMDDKVKYGLFGTGESTIMYQSISFDNSIIDSGISSNNSKRIVAISDSYDQLNSARLNSSYFLYNSGISYGYNYGYPYFVNFLNFQLEDNSPIVVTQKEENGVTYSLINNITTFYYNINKDNVSGNYQVINNLIQLDQSYEFGSRKGVSLSDARLDFAGNVLYNIKLHAAGTRESKTNNSMFLNANNSTISNLKLAIYFESNLLTSTNIDAFSILLHNMVNSTLQNIRLTDIYFANDGVKTNNFIKTTDKMSVAGVVINATSSSLIDVVNTYTIQATNSTTSEMKTAGIVVKLENSTMQGCKNYGSVTAINNKSAGSNGDNVAGIAYEVTSNSTIDHCTNSGRITASNGKDASGTDSSENGKRGGDGGSAGGIAYVTNNSTITWSTNTARITGGSGGDGSNGNNGTNSTHPSSVNSSTGWPAYIYYYNPYGSTSGKKGGDGGNAGYTGGIVAKAENNALIQSNTNTNTGTIQGGNGGDGGDGGKGGNGADATVEIKFYFVYTDCIVKYSSSGSFGGNGGKGGNANLRYGQIIGTKDTSVTMNSNNTASESVVETVYCGAGGNGGAGGSGGDGDSADYIIQNVVQLRACNGSRSGYAGTTELNTNQNYNQGKSRSSTYGSGGAGGSVCYGHPRVAVQPNTYR